MYTRHGVHRGSTCVYTRLSPIEGNAVLMTLAMLQTSLSFCFLAWLLVWPQLQPLQAQAQCSCEGASTCGAPAWRAPRPAALGHCRWPWASWPRLRVAALALARAQRHTQPPARLVPSCPWSYLRDEQRNLAIMIASTNSQKDTR